MYMKCLIKDLLTNKYYSITYSEIGRNGQLTAGPNDFPYWSQDIANACIFDAILFAKNEMQFNDLTQDGERQPVIVDESGCDIPNLYLVKDGAYYLQSTD